MLSAYRLCRVLFGVISSPFLQSATLLTHAKKYLDKDPEFVKKLIQSLHGDSLNTSSDSDSEGLIFYQNSKLCLKEGGFNHRKLESNSKELCDLIQEDNFASSNISKVLGLKRNKSEDCFIFSFQELLTTVNTKPTKRDIFKFIASFFEPLGLLNPVIVRCKILFQSICKLKRCSNVIIDSDILNEWNQIVRDFNFCALFLCAKVPCEIG